MVGTVQSSVWDPVETLSRDEMTSLQVRRFRSCLERLSARVPLYRDRLAALGAAAKDVRSLDDLPALPFTVKQDLRDAYPFGMFATPMDEVVRIHASSGTTGQMTVVGYTANDVATWAGLAARSLHMATVTPGDIIHNSYGYGLFTGGLGLHYGAELIGATVVPVSAGATRRQISLLQDFGATVLCCTPSYSLLIAEEASAQGIDLSGGPLRVGIFGAEPWSEQMRGEIESRLGLTALDIYGLSEVMGPAVAMECPFKQGMHIAEDHFIPEVIDPETGAPVPFGEAGELVFTCVTKEALPLLRYRTRDLTRLFYGPCPCGRTTVRMEKVLGRSDDMLIVRGVNVFPSQIEAVLLGIRGLEPHYELVLERGVRQLDELTVRVEAGAGLSGDAAALGEIERRLAGELQTALGIGCRVSVVGVREISRSEGKAVRVVDNRRI